MIDDNEKNEIGADPNAVEGGRRVVLLAGGGPLLKPLALALAGRGDSIILWEADETGVSEGAATEDVAGGDSAFRIPHFPFLEAGLDLQLAIERAGGISLRGSGGELGGAAEALGRIDAAVALTREAARRVLAAVEPLERRLRPARLIAPQAPGATENDVPLSSALNAESARAALGREVPPGIRIYAVKMQSGREPSEFETLTAILDLI